MIQKVLFAATAVVCFCVTAAPVSAQFGQGNSANHLFSQYQTGAGPNATTAGMYPAPYDSPQLGAQSYYTYQPLMPHEMMYQHSRNYFNYYNTGGYMSGFDSLNKTKVRWQSGSNHMGPLPLTTSLGGGLNYWLHSKVYCLGGNCGGSGGLRGHLQGRRGFRGGFGCASGNCDDSMYTGDGYEGEVYGNDVYGGEVQSSGCAGGCTANLSDNTLNR